MILLDGSLGEGGGQILRSALALSVVTGQPFRITRIRAGRAKPGLMRQHLACVEASARIGCARTTGAELGSTELQFEPGGAVAGHYEFKISSAGSAMLLLQTILPPLLRLDQPSEIVLEGGTHNPFAPPFPFIALAFLPRLRELGYDVQAVLERAGFYPNGGGRCRVRIGPARSLTQGVWETGPDDPIEWSARVCLAGLPASVGERQLASVRRRLPLAPDRCGIDTCPEAIGPGNTLHLIATRRSGVEVFTGFGAPRVRAEAVAEEACAAAETFHASGAAVGEQLADQLLLPLALARGGSLVTSAPSEHTRTNATILQAFLPVQIALTPETAETWRIQLQS